MKIALAQPEQEKLALEIAKLASDFRAGEIAAFDAAHVNRWVHQFDEPVRVAILRELLFSLSKTYISKDFAKAYLSGLIKNTKLAGENYCDYWKRANFLNIQQNGHSQEELLEIFDEQLSSQCGLNVCDCGSDDGDYIYIDDAIFTGGRAGDDICEWMSGLENKKIVLRIIVIAMHTFAEYKSLGRIRDAAKGLGIELKLDCWRNRTIENKKANSYISEVLWPVAQEWEEAIQEYIDKDKKFPFEPRKPGGTLQNKFFSSEDGRQLLENQLLRAGMKIRSFCASPKDILRPLGFGPFGLGFGATLVTYRNCPNNCPLALWWGDPSADSSHPLSKWYPLFPRKTYPESVDYGALFDFDDEETPF